LCVQVAPALETLNLGGCNVGPDGAAAVMSALKERKTVTRLILGCALVWRLGNRRLCVADAAPAAANNVQIWHACCAAATMKLRRCSFTRPGPDGIQAIMDAAKSDASRTHR
jgi:hypothetical protein